MRKKAFVPPSKQSAVPEQEADVLQVRSSALPGQLTSLIGREQEVMAACALLRHSNVRLLTLTGPGGVGKTRLAVQIATELVQDFADGAYFIALAPISDADFVLPTIAKALDLGETATLPLLERLKAFLQEKRLLLILDNFEQIVATAPLLAELLKACGHLKMLVTSREVLRVSGEREFAVRPLALPDLQHLPDRESLSEYPAVALFVERAQSIERDFALTEANARVISEICTRLDGLPLAIELAAARVKLLPPHALLSRLEHHRLDVLTAGVRDLPVRHQTLRSAISWSYDLLNEEEQRLFRRVSVFVGGCTLDAVEGIYSAMGDPTTKMLDIVGSLIDKSLLQQVVQGNGEPRLMMLETIREYASEQLAASEEMEAIGRAHANYYRALAEDAELQTTGTQQAEWLERLEWEHDNLRAALRWSMDREEGELALRLSGAMWWFWSVHGHLGEGLQWLMRALAKSEGVGAAVVAKALYGAASLACAQDENERAGALWSKGLELYREIGDRRGIANSLYKLGVVEWSRSNYAAACALEEEALVLFKELGDKGGIADALLLLAYVAINEGKYARAITLIEESLTLFRGLGDKWGLAYSLRPLAYVVFLQGDSERAYSLINECLTLCRELGYKGGIAFALSVLGQFALSEGDDVKALSLIEESLGIRTEVGDRWGIAESLYLLAKVRASQRNYAEAYNLYKESLAKYQESGDRWYIAACLEGLGEMVAAQGQLAWAGRLWGAAELLRETIGVPLSPAEFPNYERMVKAVRSKLGEEGFRRAWAEGRTMTYTGIFLADIPLPAQKSALSSKSTSVISRITSTTPSPAGLTVREIDVLRLVAMGLTDIQVAEKLVISRRTVNAHLTSIYSKIQVSTRSAATRYALDHKLV